MFKTIVNSLVEGERVCWFQANIRPFYQALREVEPNSFAKDGKKIIFVGKKNDLFSREAEIMEKIIAMGYSGPITQKYKRELVLTPTESKVAQLSDEELFNRINDTFSSLSLLAEAAANLKIRSLIVSGSPGVGKTFEVLKAVKNRAKKDNTFYHHTVKGVISEVVLFMELYHARNGVLILDDTDNAFTDDKCLQMLKAATESSKERLVSYNKLSLNLEAEGIPNEFNFQGCVIILTNTNLEEARKNRQMHYDAIVSRAHYINAILSTNREKLVRIRHVIKTSSLLKNYINEKDHSRVIDFVNKHQDDFRELSIRTVVKLAELCSAFPENWEVLARGTLLV